MAYLRELFKTISERLNPSDMRTFTSLIEEFRFHKIGERQLLTSLLCLFEKHDHLYQWFKQFESSDKDGKPREDEDGNCLPDPKIDQLEANYADTTRVEVDDDPKKNVSGEKHDTKVFVKIVLKGKKRRIMDSDRTERTLKKTRMSRPIREQVTPSYRLIPEDKQCPASNTALNNKCSLNIARYESKIRDLTDSEEAMAMCEDDMYEADMLVEILKSAVGRAEKVMNGEMRLEDIGVKFYKCIGQLYRRDMVEAVRQNHQKALPVILNRLKQKLNEMTLARESIKPDWKQVFQENSAKERDPTTAQGRRKTRLF